MPKAKVCGHLDIEKFIDSLPTQIDRQPHSTRKIFREFEIKNQSIADAIDLAPCTVSQILGGHLRASRHVDFTLKALAAYLVVYGKSGVFDDKDFSITEGKVKRQT